MRHQLGVLRAPEGRRAQLNGEVPALMRNPLVLGGIEDLVVQDGQTRCRGSWRLQEQRVLRRRGAPTRPFQSVVIAVQEQLVGARLLVCTVGVAYGTQLRWKAPKLIAAANERVSGANVRSVHVLAPAPVKAGPTRAAAAPAPQPAVSAAPVERRTPPEGLPPCDRGAPAGRPAVPG